MTDGSMGAELFHSDERMHGQTNMKKLTVAFAILRTHLKIKILTYIEHAFLLYKKYLMFFRETIIHERL